MGNIPNDRNDLFLFASGHAQTFMSHDSAIGLTEPQAQRVVDAVAGYSAKLAAAETAKAAAKAATLNLTEAARELRTATSEAVTRINLFAANAPSPEAVYALANIDPPAPRTSTLPPVAPSRITVGLDFGTGALVLRWTASQPRGVTGVVYNVRRTIGSGNPVSVGLIGEKRFIDTTIPAGTSLITYTITAQRGSQVSEQAATVVVRFGVGGGGMFIAGVQGGDIDHAPSASTGDDQQRQAA